jgi:hypothetical protein
LDVSLWGKAAMALSEAASEAAGMAQKAAMCDAGDDVACRIFSEKKKHMGGLSLDKLDVPNWDAAAVVLSNAASDTASVAAAALEKLEGFGFLKGRHAFEETELAETDEDDESSPGDA